jgi:hypothetical protein
LDSFIIQAVPDSSVFVAQPQSGIFREAWRDVSSHGLL